MSGYSKIKSSDKLQNPFDQNENDDGVDITKPNNPQSPEPKNGETKETMMKNKDPDSCDPLEKQEESKKGSGEGNGFGCAKLCRNRSVSSAYGLESVKRTFSIKRSSSVTERYSRIHDQSITLSSSPLNEEEDDDDHGDLKKKKKKRSGRSKIFGACKKFFGL